jgi:Mor family transcriptional regulator
LIAHFHNWLCTLFDKKINKGLANMKYLKANAVLPEELIMEIQKYVQGETIYIPKSETTRRWGLKSGSRSFYDSRNSSIRTAFTEGRTIQELADEYFLSMETIKKIVYAKH